MSWKSEARKHYETRVMREALTRLAARIDLESVPLSAEELTTLARRAREHFKAHHSEVNRQRALRFKSQLGLRYGEECVGRVWSLLEAINNEIGYEEK